MEKSSRAVVFRTPNDVEVAAVRAALEKAEIPSEAQVAVPADYEGAALELIEALMKDAGIKPVVPEGGELEPPESGPGDIACPNCEQVGPVTARACAGCGFELRPPLDELPPLVKDYEPDSRSFCPECRSPLTFASGACKTCGEELEPLEAADRLCPELTHVLFRDTVGGLACKICRRVWLSEPA